MIAEIGLYALVLALALALVQACVPLYWRAPRRCGVDGGRRTYGAGAVSVRGGLVRRARDLLVRSDFSVANVFENSHSLKPLIYKISGVWGNHEGSMVLWILILGAIRRAWSRASAATAGAARRALGVQA